MARDLNRLFEDLRNSREVYVTKDGNVERADEASENAEREERREGQAKARTRLKPEIFGRGDQPLFVDGTVLTEAHRLAAEYTGETGAIGVGPDEHTLTELIPSGPKAKRTASSFELDADYLQPLLEQAESRGLRFVAFWHSHPFGCPRPSETDRGAAKRMLNDEEWGLSGHVYLPISVRRRDAGFETRFFIARGPNAVIEEAQIVVTSRGRAAAARQPVPQRQPSEALGATERLQRDQLELEQAGWQARLRETETGLLLRAEHSGTALWFVLPPEYPLSPPDVLAEEDCSVRAIPLVDLPELISWSSLRSLVTLAEQARKSVEDLKAVESQIIRPRAFPLIQLVRSVRFPFLGAR